MTPQSSGGHDRSDRAVRGVFAIPPTPFDQAGEIDEASLRRCADFCVGAGAHGIVAPVNASEAIALTDLERLRVAEIIVDEVANRIPVIIGVSGTSTASSTLYADHARRIGADAVIAMPPYVRHPPADEILSYYRAVAEAARGLPVWIQHYVPPVGTWMSAELIARILHEVPGVDYVKEESAYAPQMMTQIQAAAGPALAGIMGGMAGRYMIEEHRRGASGTMPACEVVDLHVAVWNALESGELATAIAIHRAMLPLLTYEAMYSFTAYKEVLVRRGLIDTAVTRIAGAGVFDATNHAELDRLLADLAPLMEQQKSSLRR